MTIGWETCRAALNFGAAELWAGAEPWQIGVVISGAVLVGLLAGWGLARR